MAVQRITNSDLSDIQWLQASLPVKDGGLGVRRISSLDVPAFLASAECTLSLQDDILSGSIYSNSQHLQSYLTTCSTAYGAVPDTCTLPSSQPFWDRQGVLADRAIGEFSLTTLFTKHLSWQLPRVTVEIGFLPCQSLRVACGLTMRL